MPRKTKNVTITNGTPETNRDYGKVFLLTEFPSVRGERWAVRVMMALMKAGADIPAGAELAGMAGVAASGFQALANLDSNEALSLMDEMLAAVKIYPDYKANQMLTRDLIGEDDIEEIYTRIQLRAEVFDLHTGFSSAVDFLKKLKEVPAARKSPISSSAQTSREASTQS